MDSFGPDLRLLEDCPAVDAGVVVPKEWPDPLRERDGGKLDVGAFPVGVEPWNVRPVTPAKR